MRDILWWRKALEGNLSDKSNHKKMQILLGHWRFQNLFQKIKLLLNEFGPGLPEEEYSNKKKGDS